MPKEFIIRGRTASGLTEVLNMGTPSRPGIGYNLTEFVLSPSANIHDTEYEIAGTVTAGKVPVPPGDIDFNNLGLIASGQIENDAGHPYPISSAYIVNDLFVITQNLILMVLDQHNQAINWQLRFKEVKLTGPAEAVANFKQYTIYNTSS